MSCIWQLSPSIRYPRPIEIREGDVILSSEDAKRLAVILQWQLERWRGTEPINENISELSREFNFQYGVHLLAVLKGKKNG